MHLKFYLLCVAILAGIVGNCVPQVQAAADPPLKCQAGKLKESARYGACRLKAESRHVKTGRPVDFTKCETKFTAEFNKAETKAGPGVCPSEDDEVSMNARITTDAAGIATLLAGGTPLCGDGFIQSGEQCDGTDLGGADCATLGFTGGALACFGSCFFDTSICTGSSGLARFIETAPILTKTGQTGFFGAGSDGAVEAGRALSYSDNGDGTITDNNTGLMWEKKDDSGGIHDKDNTYQWSTKNAFIMNGTMVKQFLNTLNDVAGGGTSCFADHCDWRIPNIKELGSIALYEFALPAIDPAFHQSATCTGCTDVNLETCSCTSSFLYWSSTSVITFQPLRAWALTFVGGRVISRVRTNGLQVRAVRGGL